MSFSCRQALSISVKGQRVLTAAELRPGCGIRFDRAFGLALSTAQYDPTEPQWMPKRNFVTLVAPSDRRRRSAHGAGGILTVHRGGKPASRAAPSRRRSVERCWRNSSGPTLRMKSAEHRSSSAPRAERCFRSRGAGALAHRACNPADLDDCGRPVDPPRFRANVYLPGRPRLGRVHWVGKELTLGTGGKVIDIAEMCRRQRRSATGVRDMTIPQDLQRVFGHADCVLAAVTNSGEVALGDEAAVVTT